MFDKLDDKLSSLIRNLGLIITLLFGIVTYVSNFKFNVIMSNMIVFLIILFAINIVMTFITYLITSSEKENFLYELENYRQFSNYVGTSVHS